MHFFMRGEFDVELQLVLRRDEMPASELEEAGQGALRLGWSTWASPAAMNRNPDETILLLD